MVIFMYKYVTPQAGMFAIRARRKVATERDFLDAVEKVVRQGTKFSSTYVGLFFPLVLRPLTLMADHYIRYTISSVTSPGLVDHYVLYLPCFSAPADRKGCR